VKNSKTHILTKETSTSLTFIKSFENLKHHKFFEKNLVGEIIDFHTTKILEIVEILQTTKVFNSHMYMKLHNSLLHHGNICNQSSAQKPKCTHEIMKFCEFS